VSKAIKEDWKNYELKENWLNPGKLKVFIDEHPRVLENIVEPGVIGEIINDLMREIIQKNYKPPIMNSDELDNEVVLEDEFAQILSYYGYNSYNNTTIANPHIYMSSLITEWRLEIIPQIYIIKEHCKTKVPKKELLNTEKIRDCIGSFEYVQSVLAEEWNEKFGIPEEQYLNELIDNYFGSIKKLLIEEKFQDCPQKDISKISYYLEEEFGFSKFPICDEYDVEFIGILIKESTKKTSEIKKVESEKIYELKEKYEDKVDEEESDKYKTYVHEPALLRIIQPWFKEHEFQDTSSSVPSKTDSYQGAFMVPVVLIGSLFVGKYLYQKFFKKLPAKKTSME
jgi:hypothetical protein